MAVTAPFVHMGLKGSASPARQASTPLRISSQAALTSVSALCQRTPNWMLWESRNQRSATFTRSREVAGKG